MIGLIEIEEEKEQFEAVKSSPSNKNFSISIQSSSSLVEIVALLPRDPEITMKEVPVSHESELLVDDSIESPSAEKESSERLEEHKEEEVDPSSKSSDQEIIADESSSSSS